MRATRPRLIDIANEVGVHRTVVSRALSGDPTLNIRPETRELIRSTADRMGYRANTVARALRAKMVGAVAIGMPSLRNPVWAEIVRGALAEAVRRDTAVLLAEVPDDSADDTEYTRLVEEGRIDGLLLGNSEQVERFRDIPCVHVNRAVADAGCNVVMDEAAAVRLVVDHLAGLGHRHLGLVDGPAGIDTTRRRVAALGETGLRVDVVHEEFDEGGGYRGMAALLGGPEAERPTAVAVASLTQVVGALAALRRAGRRAPDDVSVVCFDDDPLLDYLEVEVTAVRMPLFELGEAGMRALLDLIGGATPTSVQLDSPMDLIVRRSTQPIGGAVINRVWPGV